MLSLFLAFRNVVRNRERSLLTLIGVLLAIGSFVALVSLAEGLSQRITRELDSRNVHIYVLPKRALALPSGPIGTIGYSQDTIGKEVKDRLAEMPNVQLVDGVNRASWTGRGLLPVIFLERQSIAAFFPRVEQRSGHSGRRSGTSGVWRGDLGQGDSARSDPH